MYLIVLCFVLHQIVGLKAHGFDRKSLVIRFVGLNKDTVLCTASDASSDQSQTSKMELLRKG